MKTPRIVESVGYIEDDLINGAINSTKTVKKKSWLKWGSLAACLAVMVMAGTVLIPMLNGGNTSVPDAGNIVLFHDIERNYKDIAISGGESSIEWPWEYMTISEKYESMKFKDREYVTRARSVDRNLLGEVLGTCKAEGYDTYGEKKYTETFEVRKINGVSEEHLVAVGMDGEFYVYMYNSADRPATFGEVLDIYALEQTLEFNRFTIYESYNDKGHYVLSDDAYIWQVLSECRDAALFENCDSWERGDRNYLSFTATSESLGIYKKVFYITEDGYVSTNIFNYSYVYYIGEDAAEKIIRYAKSNSTETEPEPYAYTLAGTITEIADGYILIDDSVLCVNESEGMTFKVSTDDLRISRCLKYDNIKVGDTVVVMFTGEINKNADNTVEGAYSLSKGQLIDDGIAVPE